MKLVCSRLARTVQDLADYVYEIRYTPGHMNCAADALSRLNHKVPEHDKVSSGSSLPAGLVLDGQPVPGGGDSLFISLHKVLTNINNCRLPESVDGLRAQLVEDLVSHPAQYLSLIHI